VRGVIEQGRVAYLRAPRPRDRTEFLRLSRASRDLHRPWVYAPETPREFAAYLDRCARDTERCFLACFESAYLGYYAFAASAGQGLMADGLELVLRHTFRKLKLHRIEANIQPDNERSKRLVERAGFRCEGYSPRYLKIGGRWRDHERWAITREDWTAR
jgi:ribosomal-protein-alanine N-acetyltransferase